MRSYLSGLFPGLVKPLPNAGAPPNAGGLPKLGEPPNTGGLPKEGATPNEGAPPNEGVVPGKQNVVTDTSCERTNFDITSPTLLYSIYVA